jgi:hypothetical protein|tara:strand:+ start:344 stop:1156 length:813 start_codon:yes stop_codon:yes gene_type:complete
MEEVQKEKKKAKVYSHSRLWLYENCPEFYKLKYIDKKTPEMPLSISLLLGKTVHEVLEWLYHQIKNHEVELDELIEYFQDKWGEHMDEVNRNVKFHNGDEKIHFNRGVKFLVDYYLKHKPFDQNVLAIERKILFPLDQEEMYFIQGYIDRLDLNSDGEYEIHDYKTNAYPKKQKELDKDRQLALYHIGIKKVYGNDIKVKLIWDFLAHNIQMHSARNDEQLEKLKEDTLNLIKKIEGETEWKACKGKWCDWCSYKKEHDVSYKEIADRDF